jgi:gliding motility-associated protein GldM
MNQMQSYCSRLLALGTALFISFSSQAQTPVSVASNQMNVLYIGIDNPLTIAAAAVPDEKMTVEVIGGTITKTGAGQYNVRVTDQKSDCKVRVLADGKLLGQSDFRVRRLPNPRATIGGYVSGENIAATTFQTQSGLGCYVTDFPFDVKYSVVSFRFSIEDDNGKAQEVRCEGNAFSPEAKALIKAYVKPGRTVYFDEIRAKDPGGEIRKLPSLVYYIK